MKHNKNQPNVEDILKLSREPMNKSITMQFEDGSTQLVRPTRAFDGNWRALCEHIAHGRAYKVAHNETIKEDKAIK